MSASGFAATKDGFATLGKSVIYGDGEQEYEGYLAKPVSKIKNIPLVILVPNWMGVTLTTQKIVKQYATLGYQTIALDVYGKGIRPTNTEEASKLVSQYKSDRKMFREHLMAGLNYALRLPGIDKQKVAAIGYCFGGTGVLELAQVSTVPRGIVSFHGGLDFPSFEDFKNIKSSILILHGALDPYSPREQVLAFQKAADIEHLDYQIVQYANAVHSFTEKGAGTDNSKGAAYNELADHRSWQTMRDFLNEIFRL